jgi:hypothetical protein
MIDITCKVMDALAKSQMDDGLLAFLSNLSQMSYGLNERDGF